MNNIYEVVVYEALFWTHRQWGKLYPQLDTYHKYAPVLTYN